MENNARVERYLRKVPLITVEHTKRPDFKSMNPELDEHLKKEGLNPANTLDIETYKERITALKSILSKIKAEDLDPDQQSIVNRFLNSREPEIELVHYAQLIYAKVYEKRTNKVYSYYMARMALDLVNKNIQSIDQQIRRSDVYLKGQYEKIKQNLYQEQSALGKLVEAAEIERKDISEAIQREELISNNLNELRNVLREIYSQIEQSSRIAKREVNPVEIKRLLIKALQDIIEEQSKTDDITRTPNSDKPKIVEAIEGKIKRAFKSREQKWDEVSFVLICIESGYDRKQILAEYNKKYGTSFSYTYIDSLFKSLGLNYSEALRDVSSARRMVPKSTIADSRTSIEPAAEHRSAHSNLEGYLKDKFKISDINQLINDPLKKKILLDALNTVPEELTDEAITLIDFLTPPERVLEEDKSGDEKDKPRRRLIKGTIAAESRIMALFARSGNDVAARKSYGNIISWCKPEKISEKIVSEAIKSLVAKGYLSIERNNHYRITKEGIGYNRAVLEVKKRRVNGTK